MKTSLTGWSRCYLSIYSYVVSPESGWDGRRLDSVELLHGLNCSGDMGEEDFDEEDEDLEDEDEEEISVT